MKGNMHYGKLLEIGCDGRNGCCCCCGSKRSYRENRTRGGLFSRGGGQGNRRQIGNVCKGCFAVAQDDPYDFDDFDDFDDFETDDSVDFDTADMESDKLTDEGYIMEFDAEEEPKPAEESAAQKAPEAAEEENVPEDPVSEEDEESISTDE